LKIAVEHSDHVEGERDTNDGTGRTVQCIDVQAAACNRARIHVGRYCIDENHCAALVLALQAAVAEVQARAVSL
jgi:hypothetical protein